MSLNKHNIASIIANFLGVDNVNSMSPETAITAGLRNAKKNSLSKENLHTLQAMLQQAREAGIQVNEDIIVKKRGRPTFLSKMKTRKTPRGTKPVPKAKPETTATSNNLGRPEGSTNEPGDDHIIMQLRSAQDLDGNKVITFRSGGDHKVDPQHISKILKLHDRMQTPTQKRLLRTLVAKSHDSLKTIASQIKEETEEDEEHIITSADLKIGRDGRKYPAHRVIVNKKVSSEDINENKTLHCMTCDDVLKRGQKDDHAKGQDYNNNCYCSQTCSDEQPVDEDAIVDSIDDEDDILHLYDPDELVIVDSTDGQIVEDTQDVVEETGAMDPTVELLRKRSDSHKLSATYHLEQSHTDDTEKQQQHLKAAHLHTKAAQLNLHAANVIEQDITFKNNTRPNRRFARKNANASNFKLAEMAANHSFIANYHSKKLKSDVVENVNWGDNHINEVMTRTQRLKARMRFLRTKSKRQRKLQIALRKRSDNATIARRARRLAIEQIKVRMMRKPISEMTVSEKERIERILAKRKPLIDRLALRLAPKIRRIETERLSHSAFTQPHN